MKRNEKNGARNAGEAMTTTTTMTKVLSYGAGLDSFAMLLDAVLNRGEKPDVVCHINVGDAAGRDPGEWGSTRRHIAEVVIPFCEQHGIEFVELNDANGYPVRGQRSLYAWLDGLMAIPTSGPSKLCTIVAKVERFEKWLVDRFGTELVEVWIGFSADEGKRVAKDPNAASETPTRKNRFPLYEAGLCRCKAEKLIVDLGYPVPRKSACTFCPFASKCDYRKLEQERPQDLAAAVKLETQKAPTAKNGYKLSVKNFRKLTDRNLSTTGEMPVLGVDYTAPTLTEWLAKPDRSRTLGCDHCGRARRAVKHAGDDYLTEAEYVDNLPENA